MQTPLRVFVSAATGDDRRRLRDAAERAGWRVVERADDADVVLSDAVAWPRPATPAALDPDRLERPIEAVTPREREVLVLLADGLGNREIAVTLGISDHTVKFHLGAIFGKLGASTRTEAVRKALGLGLVDL